MKTKILIVTDGFSLVTGYSIVAKNIYKILRDKYDIYFFSRIPYNPIENEPVKNYICDSLKYDEHFAKVMNAINPDIVFTVGDLWKMTFVSEYKQRKWFRWVHYMGIEGKNYPAVFKSDGVLIPFKKLLESVDVIVPYSQFAKDEIERFGVKCENHIYHGVDTNVFKPKNIDRNKLLNELFPAKAKDNPFIFISIGDNFVRKRFDLLLKAWKKFINKNTNAILFVITAPINYDTGYNIPELIGRYGIAESVYYANNYEKGVGFKENALVDIYNLADCFILMSNSEGFGLPYLEAMACGTPVIYTDYATPAEFIGDNGMAVNVRDFFIQNYIWYDVAEPDINDAASKMKDIYSKSHLQKKYREKGIETALKMDWQNMRESWEAVFDNIMERKRKYGVLI